MFRSLLTILLLLLCSASVHAADDAVATAPSEGDAFATELLSGLRSAYRGIERERGTGDALALKIQFDLAIQSLTSLEQLFGFDWARQRLRAIYLEPDCPDLHMGYSADRRVLLRIEPMELKNPVFSEHSFFLCTLESQHAEDITADSREQLVMELKSGERMKADIVEPGYGLWEHLQGQAESFQPPQSLASARNVVFKQLYAVPALSRDSISAVSLDWDEYQFTLEWFENEVAID